LPALLQKIASFQNLQNVFQIQDSSPQPPLLEQFHEFEDVIQIRNYNPQNTRDHLKEARLSNPPRGVAEGQWQMHELHTVRGKEAMKPNPRELPTNRVPSVLVGGE